LRIEAGIAHEMEQSEINLKARQFFGDKVAKQQQTLSIKNGQSSSQRKQKSSKTMPATPTHGTSDA
jgi:hypothetical protein